MLHFPLVSRGGPSAGKEGGSRSAVTENSHYQDNFLMILLLQVEEFFKLESVNFGINMSLLCLKFLTSGNLESFCPRST